MANQTVEQFNDAYDSANAHALQLQALLANTYGESTFQNMSDDLQENYLWACSKLADGIVTALRSMSELQRTILATHD